MMVLLPIVLNIIKKIFQRLFCFPIEICLHRFCRTFHDASFKIKFKILSFSQAEDLCKIKKVFEIFFIILNITIMKVVHFEYELGHQNKSVSICSDIFCRAFHAASLKKIQDLSFNYDEICAKYILHHIGRFQKIYHHILMFIFLLL